MRIARTEADSVGGTCIGKMTGASSASRQLVAFWRVFACRSFHWRLDWKNADSTSLASSNVNELWSCDSHFSRYGKHDGQILTKIPAFRGHRTCTDSVAKDAFSCAIINGFEARECVYMRLPSFAFSHLFWEALTGWCRPEVRRQADRYRESPTFRFRFVVF